MVAAGLLREVHVTPSRVSFSAESWRGMRRKLFILAVLIGLVAGTGTGNAQVAGTGTIVVTVLDPSGGVLPGVAVTATAANATTKRTVATDATGKATILALEPSESYVVTVALQGFKSSKFEKVLVRSGQVTDLKATLTIGGVS